MNALLKNIENFIGSNWDNFVTQKCALWNGVVSKIRWKAQYFWVSPGTNKEQEEQLTIFTPHVCARGKVIGFIVVVIVVVSTKITKSQKVGAGQSALCHQTIESHEKLSSVCFKSLRTAHVYMCICSVVCISFCQLLLLSLTVVAAHDFQFKRRNASSSRTYQGEQQPICIWQGK